MAETLLSPSNILLYGRVMTDMTLAAKKPDEKNIDDVKPPNAVRGKLFPQPLAPPRLGANKFLQNQLLDQDALLARIYAFSYEGHYYDLAKPAIFLVHGPGQDPEAWRPDNALPNARVDRAPADADRTGVASTPASFSEDMRVWAYDKGDFSIRLDIETGSFDQILLDLELQMDLTEQSYSGASARISGASARLSGASARLSGASARLRNRAGGYSD
jgi:hypothetical protein